MITNEDDCSALAGRSAVRHQRQHDARRPARARPATSAATSSATSATARAPSRLAPNDDVSATQTYDSCVSAEDGVAADGRRHRRAHQGAQARSGQPDHGRGDHRARDAVHRALEGAAQERRHRARGRRSRTSCTAADGSYADPSVAHQPARARVRRQRPAAVDLRRRVRAARCSASPTRSAITSAKPCIAGAVAKKPGTAQRRLHGRQLRRPMTAGNVIETPGRRLRRHRRRGPVLAARRRRERPAPARRSPSCRDPSAPPPIWENAARAVRAVRAPASRTRRGVARRPSCAKSVAVRQLRLQRAAAARENPRSSSGPQVATAEDAEEVRMTVEGSVQFVARADLGSAGRRGSRRRLRPEQPGKPGL